MGDTLTPSEIVKVVTRKSFVTNVERIPDYLDNIRIPGPQGPPGTGSGSQGATGVQGPQGESIQGPQGTSGISGGEILLASEYNKDAEGGILICSQYNNAA
jgi:hypothetical protein